MSLPDTVYKAHVLRVARKGAALPYAITLMRCAGNEWCAPCQLGDPPADVTETSNPVGPELANDPACPSCGCKRSAHYIGIDGDDIRNCPCGNCSRPADAWTKW